MSRSPHKIALITAPGSIAEELAREIIDARMAACVQVFPGGRSFFRWDGDVQSETESLLICKTAEHRIDDISRLLTLRHPYEVPELLVVPVESGLPSYLSWMLQETGGNPS